MSAGLGQLPLGLREVGTGYFGKEPHEYVADVLRTLVRLAGGGELGFEGCLTTRAFTARTFIEQRLGSMTPGRSSSEGVVRARLDFSDGLALLGELGWRHRTTALLPSELPAREATYAVVAGPLEVEPRWCPAEDRIAHGGAFRHLIVERWFGDRAICFDPVLGGYTSLSAESLSTADVIIVEAPARMPDVVAAARRCLFAGAAARIAAQYLPDDRDETGFRRSAEAAAGLTSGGAATRLRLALRNQALQALRWAALLGHSGAVDMDTLTLADVLREFAVGCRRAHTAAVGRDRVALSVQLRTLADLAAAITELAARLAQRPA